MANGMSPMEAKRRAAVAREAKKAQRVVWGDMSVENRSRERKFHVTDSERYLQEKFIRAFLKSTGRLDALAIREDLVPLSLR